jgi:long-subunit fatty acid transport protein
MKRFRLLTALLILAANPLAAYFKPWYLLTTFAFGSKALAMGNAFTAVADDASASFWNPAGLAQLDAPEFMLSYRACRQSHLYDTLTVEYPASDILTKALYDSTFRSRINGVDYFALSLPVRFWGKQWGFAFSYMRYFPSGFSGQKYQTSTLFYYDEAMRVSTVQDDFSGSEGQDALAMSVSCRISEKLFAGMTVQRYFNSGSLNYTATRESYVSTQEFNEKLIGGSFIFGLLYKPLRLVTLGFAYHSAADVRMPSSEEYLKMDLDGNVISGKSYECEARVHLPAMFSFGVRVDPFRNLVLSADYTAIDWSHSTMRDYYGQTKTLPFPIRNDRADGHLDNDPFIPGDMSGLRLGMEWNLPMRKRILHLRSGWSVQKELVRDTLGDQVHTRSFSVGAGVELSAALRAEFTIAVQRAIWPEDSILSATETSSTRYRYDQFNLALVYHFGNLFRAD